MTLTESKQQAVSMRERIRAEIQKARDVTRSTIEEMRRNNDEAERAFRKSSRDKLPAVKR